MEKFISGNYRIAENNAVRIETAEGAIYIEVTKGKTMVELIPSHDSYGPNVVVNMKRRP